MSVQDGDGDPIDWLDNGPMKVVGPNVDENGIAKAILDPGTAYFYASTHVKGRWPEGEAAIAQSWSYSYMYARNVIRGRFLEGESIIASNPITALDYACEVVKGRWREGEAIIATSPYRACLYARFVLNRRWLEVEQSISESDSKQDYLNVFPEAREDWVTSGWIDWLDT